MRPTWGAALWGALLLAWGLRATRKGPPEDGTFYYGSFPQGFSWGVGSSAFQTEGAWEQDSKGPSVWDTFTLSGRGRAPGDTAEVACDSYHRVQEDVALLRELGVTHYRFSLSWPRLLPTGVRADGLNQKGLRFYSDLIDALLQSNITPVVTLHHWDLPQPLQARWGGWQNASMAALFRDYADLCFQAFGDRVRLWLTFADPRTMVEEGYETGRHPPGLQLQGTGLYVAAHHIIKAHTLAWHSYNSTWRGRQRGLVGISLSCSWAEPLDAGDPEDLEAAERFLHFCLGWFAGPIFTGDYPQAMKQNIGRKSVEQGLERSRLPAFSRQEQGLIRGTADFLGLGHFTTRYVAARSWPAGQGPSYRDDQGLQELADPRWPAAGYPWGIRRLLHFAQTQYGDPPIYVSENGVPQRTACAQLCDEWRVRYLRGYVNEVLKAIKDGVRVRGYTCWSLLDQFEWDRGYAERYGFYFVDFASTVRPRYPKASAHFYKRMVQANGFPSAQEVGRWHLQALESCSINSQMLAAEPLRSHMQMVTEIVVPTVGTLCVLLAAVLLAVLLRRRC
ncbi:lactase-like protein [Erinaceus europaeus]|uniref:Cytosolic beta-glucosidase n=1 Tax=Erinaceus europaeus TaxID=9365 RepID=A0A1S3AN72_ERIEU|nr:lactase-like protein [Erinaceus europaeus]